MYRNIFFKCTIQILLFKKYEILWNCSCKQPLENDYRFVFQIYTFYKFIELQGKC